MPKSRKNKFSDFQKVKFKVGKKKPKGTNVTNTSFVSRGIVLKDQLRSNEEVKLKTRRNLSINDLLTQMNHHNSNTRKGAIEGVNELLDQGGASKFWPSTKALGPTLRAVSSLTADLEGGVRREAISLISRCLATSSLTAFGTFYGELSARVNVALTHIREDIRVDALTFLDLLMEHFPDLFVKNSAVTVQNLLNMSSSKQEASVRVKFLVRLHRALSLLAERTKKSSEPTHPSVMRREVEGRDYFYLKPRFCPIISYSFSRQAPTSAVENESCVEKLIEKVIPLLVRNWVEETAQDKAEDLSKLAVVADSLKSLLALAQCRLSKSKFQAVISPHMESIQRYIISSFPFEDQSLVISSKKRRNNTHMKVISAEPLNLRLCQLIVSLVLFYKDPSEILNKVASYLVSHSLNSASSRGTSSLSTALSVAKHLLDFRCLSPLETVNIAKVPTDASLPALDKLLDGINVYLLTKRPTTSADFSQYLDFYEREIFAKHSISLEHGRLLAHLLMQLVLAAFGRSSSHTSSISTDVDMSSLEPEDLPGNQSADLPQPPKTRKKVLGEIDMPRALACLRMAVVQKCLEISYDDVANLLGCILAVDPLVSPGADPNKMVRDLAPLLNYGTPCDSDELTRQLIEAAYSPQISLLNLRYILETLQLKYIKVVEEEKSNAFPVGHFLRTLFWLLVGSKTQRYSIEDYKECPSSHTVGVMKVTTVILKTLQMNSSSFGNMARLMLEKGWNYHFKDSAETVMNSPEVPLFARLETSNSSASATTVCLTAVTHLWGFRYLSLCAAFRYQFGLDRLRKASLMGVSLLNTDEYGRKTDPPGMNQRGEGPGSSETADDTESRSLRAEFVRVCLAKLMACLKEDDSATAGTIKHALVMSGGVPEIRD